MTKFKTEVGADGLPQTIIPGAEKVERKPDTDLQRIELLQKAPMRGRIEQVDHFEDGLFKAQNELF